MEVRKTDARASSAPGNETETNETPEARKKQRQSRTELVDENNKELQRLKTQQEAAINHLRKANAEKERAETQRLQQRIDQKNAQAQMEYQKAAELQAQANAQARRINDEERQKTTQLKSVHSDERAYRQDMYQQDLKSLDDVYKERAREKLNSVQAVRQQQAEEVQKEKSSFEDARIKQRGHFQSEIENEQKYYKNQIKGRGDHFENQFNENELKYQLAIEDQKTKYENELAKNHDTYLQQMEKYQSRGDDPFYTVKDLGAEMQETPDKYKVSLFVPESELKNFKVKVQNDRITVTGARKFEDEIRDENKKLSTNNYQTIHQEFALATPADKDMFQREYKDGMLIVTVPKRGSGLF